MPASVTADPVRDALANVRRYLLDCRNEAGHWEGELSSSALSTATALFALWLYQRRKPDTASRLLPLVEAGIQWLARHQNEDGGWGDTVLSHSNISTTVLCWAALAHAADSIPHTVRQAEAWLSRKAGSVAPDVLSRAIAARYGKDRTFSVPILTMAALAGRLGKNGWQYVPSLPFELAACPPKWFQWLKLPVVSYALPALIAIGQVGYHHRPGGNPLARVGKNLARPRTLAVLRSIQPEGGGFLEATPLTSFVSMSLIESGQAGHPVVTEGVEFLVRSARPDGSWAIDTNLSTWVTTMTVNALAGAPEQQLDGPDGERILNWLLEQQYREVHPYTQAAPGGWAWTDLPGGVPDADDTPGALLALHHLAPDDPRAREAACAGIRWLLDLQNRDGGMPTFCRGWGTLPFDRSGADLTAHALLAWSAWRTALPANLAARVQRGTEQGVRYLQREQRSDGAWVPLWFGNQHAPDEANPTYGTVRVLRALAALSPREFPALEPMIRRGVEWLLAVQNPDGGWGGDRETPASIEETALAVYGLAAFRGAAFPSLEAALERGLDWLVTKTDGGRAFAPAPIGFYFAKLWYFEKLYAPILTAAAFTAAVGSPGSR